MTKCETVLFSLLNWDFSGCSVFSPSPAQIQNLIIKAIWWCQEPYLVKWRRRSGVSASVRLLLAVPTTILGVKVDHALPPSWHTALSWWSSFDLSPSNPNDMVEEYLASKDKKARCRAPAAEFQQQIKFKQYCCLSNIIPRTKICSMAMRVQGDCNGTSKVWQMSWMPRLFQVHWTFKNESFTQQKSSHAPCLSTNFAN